MLGRRIADAAERWAYRIWSAVRQERRRTSGGWPGTLSEARYLVVGQLLPSLDFECLRELAEVDREQVARCLYRNARSSWSHLQRRDVEETA